MSTQQSHSTIHERVLAVLEGERPDRIPFVDRLELWHKGLVYAQELPERYAGMALTDIHREIGIGRQVLQAAYNIRLNGVEVKVSFEGEPLSTSTAPIVERFPDTDQFTPANRIGVTRSEYVTPRGTLIIEHTMLESMLRTGARAYLSRHPIVQEEDYRIVEYILEQAEFVPMYIRSQRTTAEIGSDGFVIPTVERIPYQQLLIDYFSSTDFFFALYDNPRAIERLLTLLDERLIDILQRLGDLDVPYVEFVDNLDGIMTNPRLFRRHCLASYQRYTEILHGQGKRVGSHTDGELKPLLTLLAESGLDVCESISPAPLTMSTFDEIWDAWSDGPIIWGGIPSLLLEDRVPQAQFTGYVDHLFDRVEDAPIILGVGDMVLPVNNIDRVRYVAEQVEQRPLH